MRRNFILFLIVACIPPEDGIDNTKVIGEVQIPPVHVSELDEAGNNTVAGAEGLPDLYVGNQIVTGTMVDPGGAAPDVDVFTIASRKTLPGEVFTIELDDMNASVLVELLDLDRGANLMAVDVQGSGQLEFPDFEPDTGLGDSGIAAPARMIKGVAYGLRITATGGTADFGYEVVMPAASPAEADFLVGAWPSDDVADRGNPVAGGTVLDWEGGSQADDYVWIGTYTMYLVRSVTGSGLDLKVEEGGTEAWVFAGDFPNLNSALISGTWYSSTPSFVKFPKDEEPRSTFYSDALEVRVKDPVIIDSVAEAIVVQEFDEGDTEPNGLQATWPPAADLATAGDALDAGTLSGPGFADRFTGNITYGPEAYGYTHDSDAWRFQVPEPSRIVISATWDDLGACLDVYLLDSVDGIGIDYAATYAQPEVGGGTTVFQPDTDYYLLMVGFLGAPEGASTDYQILLEQLPP